VKENCPPGAIVPEFQPATSDVDVCEVRSVFVHVTAVPASTVRSDGENALLPRNSAPDGVVMDDDTPPATAGGVTEGEVGAGVGESPPPQAAADATRASMIAKRRDDMKSSWRTLDGACPS